MDLAIQLEMGASLLDFSSHRRNSGIWHQISSIFTKHR